MRVRAPLQHTLPAAAVVSVFEEREQRQRQKRRQRASACDSDSDSDVQERRTSAHMFRYVCCGECVKWTHIYHERVYVCRFTHTVRALLGTFAHLICVPSLHTAAEANATAADTATAAALAASVVLNSNSYEAFIINAFDLKYAHDGGISTLNRGS